jgi:hypothetical protein
MRIKIIVDYFPSMPLYYAIEARPSGPQRTGIGLCMVQNNLKEVHGSRQTRTDYTSPDYAWRWSNVVPLGESGRYVARNRRYDRSNNH